MQIQFTGHNIEVTPALKEFTNSKFERLKRFADNITGVHVIFDIDKVQQIVEATVRLRGSEINARSESETMYKAIDLLIDKLVRQLTKYKEKHEEHR